MDPDHKMYTVTSTRQAALKTFEVIELSRVIRNCQLIPKFGDRADRAWTSQNVLDRCEKFFLNNYVDNHTFQIIY